MINTRVCWTFDHGTDSDYFLGDSMLKTISLVILSANIYKMPKLQPIKSKTKNLRLR